MKILKWLIVVFTLMLSFLNNGYMYTIDGEMSNEDILVVLGVVVLGVILPWFIYILIQNFVNKKHSNLLENNKEDNKTIKIVKTISILLIIYGYFILTMNHTIVALEGIFLVIAGVKLFSFNKSGYKLSVICCWLSIIGGVSSVIILIGTASFIGLSFVLILLILPVIHIAFAAIVLFFLKKNEVKKLFNLTHLYYEENKI